MIIQCESCSKKFIVKDSDIPEEGRMVQCSFCSVTWHQMPVSLTTKTLKEPRTFKATNEIDDSPSVDSIRASNGKTYRFLGSQWAELLPSGKTGLFAKKKIGKELDKLTGRKVKSTVQKRQKRIQKESEPLSESLDYDNQLPDIDNQKQGLGFFGYIFLLIIIAFSFVGVLRTFENDLLNYYPETEYIYELLDEQLEYVSETVKNMIVITKDLINSY